MDKDSTGSIAETCSLFTPGYLSPPPREEALKACK
jgi:hypothetical protein